MRTFKKYRISTNYVNHAKVEIQKCVILLKHFVCKISCMTKDHIQTICFGKGDVLKLTKALGASKAHDLDGI